MYLPFRGFGVHGRTRNLLLLVRVRVDVTTVTKPVVAPVGTVVVISELGNALNTAGVPLKLTLVTPVRSFPKIFTSVPTLPAAGLVSTNGGRPTDRLKTVPQPKVQFAL